MNTWTFSKRWLPLLAVAGLTPEEQQALSDSPLADALTGGSTDADELIPQEDVW